jgi:hypothetical protein
MNISLRLSLSAFIFLFTAVCFAQPTWTAVTNPAPLRSGGGMTLLSDGSILCKSFDGFDAVGNMWMKLTPDASGSYVNGTWTKATPMANSRLYFSSQLLKDGRLYVAGGEYGTGQSNGEMYDPVLNSWSGIASPGGYIADGNSAILDNGKVLQGYVSPANQSRIYDPATNTYSTIGPSLGQQLESTYLKLKDGSILFVDFTAVTSERYIPSLNQWVADANTPVNLYDPWGGETGPAILLPDGRALFLGSTGNTAIYTPSGNNSPGTWVAGPTIPLTTGCPDTPAAMMVDGKIIFTAAPSPTSASNLFTAPTYFFEYDYVSNTFTQVPSFLGGPTILDTAFNTTMIDLPDGNVLITEAATYNYYIHKPAGAPLAAGKPTITSVAQNGCTNTFSLTGLLFNGISEGASFGDDWQMNTNYPIVRLASGSNVYYARTHHWNHTGVQTGALQDTTLFDLPGTIPNGTYSLYVVANGIASNPFTFTFTLFPALISPLIAPGICSGSTFSYMAVPNSTAVTMQWTRPAVAGITNAAIITPQSANPNEVLTNTTTVPLAVVYHYTLTNGPCTTYFFVSVSVNTSFPATITGSNNICMGKTSTLTASGITTYTWNTSAITKSIVVTPSVTTVYSVSGLNSYGCISSKIFTLNIKPLPTLSVTGNSVICSNDSTLLTASGSGGAYAWSNSVTDYTTYVKPTVNTTYTVMSYGGNGCNKVDSITVIVQNCTGLDELNENIRSTRVYPNPVKNKLTVECDPEIEGRTRFMLTNVIGETVLEKELFLKQGKNNVDLNVSDLSGGVYFLEIRTGTYFERFKVIKE